MQGFVLYACKADLTLGKGLRCGYYPHIFKIGGNYRLLGTDFPHYYVVGGIFKLPFVHSHKTRFFKFVNYFSQITLFFLYNVIY